MKKIAIILLAGVITIFLTYCSGSKKAVAKPAGISYNQTIKPVFIQYCSPCHTGNGSKELYDVYANAKNDINDIIRRIELNPGQHGFMPARHAKLSDSTIALFKQWKADGLNE